MTQIHLLCSVIYSGLIASSIAYGIGKADLTENFRAWVVESSWRPEWLARLVDCSVCIGFWVCVIAPIQVSTDVFSHGPGWMVGPASVLAAWSVVRMSQ